MNLEQLEKQCRSWMNMNYKMNGVMKKKILILALAIANLFCCSCAKQENATLPTSEIKVNLVCEQQKTAMTFDGSSLIGTPYWLSADKLGVYTEVSNAESTTNAKFVVSSVDGSGKATGFTGTINNAGSGDYTFYAYYPYCNMTPASKNAVKLTVPSVQKPTAGSFDGNADILVAKSRVVAISADQEEVNVNFQFLRPLAIVQAVVIGIDDALKNDIVKSVRISVPGHVLSGDCSLDLTDGTLSGLSGNEFVQAENSDNTRILDNFNAFLMTMPVEIAAGTEMVVKVITDAHCLVKNIKVPAGGINLSESDITTLKFNMADCQINPNPTAVGGIKLLNIQLDEDAFGFNVLSDGGFENFPTKDCGYWKNHTLWYVPNYAWAYNDAGIRSGKRSLFADLNTHDWRDVVIQTVNLKKNTTYIFNMDMKKAWQDAGVYFGFRATETHDKSTADTETADWKTYSYSWNNSNDTQANIFIGAWPWDNFWIRIDNLVVKPESYNRKSYIPAGVSVSDYLKNNTFAEITACEKMTVWPLGPVSTASYGVALSNACIDGNYVSVAYAHATATDNGLVIDGFSGGTGSEIITSKEGVYCVPSAGVASSDGETQYVFYYATDTNPLSTDDWAAKGSYVVKSTDGGRIWNKVESLTKPSGSKFINTALVPVNGVAYIYGTPAGRGGIATYVARVNIDNIEDASAWRYFNGQDFSGLSENDAVSIFYGPVSEMTVFYDDDTSNYVVLYRSRTTGALVYREAQYPEGIWSGEKVAVEDPEGAQYCTPCVIAYPNKHDTSKKLYVVTSFIEDGYSGQIL